MKTPVSLEEKRGLLHELATRRGITDSYYDVEGNLHETSDEVRTELLEACGFTCSTADALRAALDAEDRKLWLRLVAPVVVRTQAELTAGLHVQIPDAPLAVEMRLQGENGREQRIEISGALLTPVDERVIDGATHRRFACPLPAPLDLGYYSLSLSVQTAGGPHEGLTRLIVCPEKAYLPAWCAEDGKVAGLAVSLYGLRSETDWGVGDLGDLRRFIRWASESLGVQFVGLSPIHAIFNRQPYNASPYLPNSRFYRNFIYLDLPAIEDFRESPEAQSIYHSTAVQEKLEELRKSETVQYENVAAVKLELIEHAFARFLRGASSTRRDAFNRYVEREADLLRHFATFCAIDEDVRRVDSEAWSWTGWPEELRDPRGAGVEQFRKEHAERILFFTYIQWQLDEQLAAAAEEARACGMGVGLYLDLALAVDRHGADFWAHRRLFVEETKSGAPPDPLGPHGQDWQFPPPDRESYRAEAYATFIEKIRRNCRYAGALRLDHVMRLIRLFWIPRDRTPLDGAYVLDYHQDLLRIVCLESVRNRTIIIGEDLGTVPDWIRDELNRRGILSYRVFYFERLADGSFKTPSEYPPLSIATLSTHDLPTLAGYWDETDLERREQAGLLVEEDDRRDARLDRRADRMRVARTLGLTIDAPVAAVRDAVVEFLASTSSALMMLNQEDLFLEHEQQNMPGTTVEHLNWARRMRYAIEELTSRQDLREASDRLRQILEQTGRATARAPVRSEQRDGT